MRFLILALILLLNVAPAFAQDAGGDARPIDPVEQQLLVIEGLQNELDGLAADRRDTQGEERALIEEHATEKRSQLRDEISKLVATLDEAKDPPAAAVERARKLLQRERKRVDVDIDAAEKALSDAKNAVGKAESPEQRNELEEAIAAANQRIVGLLGQKLENVTLREQLGAKVDKDFKKLDELLEGRARRLEALIEVARTERTAVRERAATTDDEKAAKQRDLELVDRRVEAASATLRELIELMKQRELETTKYRQLLIEATGRVTTDVLDKDVTVGLMEAWRKRGEQWLLEMAPQALFGLLLFLVIIVASWVLSRAVRGIARRSVEPTQMSTLAKDFIVRTSGRAVIIVGLLVGLSQIGVQMAPVLAGLGIAGFVVGFALQDTLSNFASGLMILVYRPFDVGDLIEVAGVSGVVEQMTLVSTSVLTLDNQKLLIPNNKIWNDVIRNVTAQERRRVDFMFGIGYGDDIDEASRVLREIAESTEHVDTEAEITIAVHELGESSVNLVVRVWTNTEHYWAVFWAINAEVKRRFDAEGISIPFPQRDVHLYRDAS